MKQITHTFFSQIIHDNLGRWNPIELVAVVDDDVDEEICDPDNDRCSRWFPFIRPAGDRPCEKKNFKC